MQIFTRPRVIATLMAVTTVAALNRFEQGRKLLGSDEANGFLPWN